MHGIERPQYLVGRAVQQGIFRAGRAGGFCDRHVAVPFTRRSAAIIDRVGIAASPDGMRPYLVDVEIRVKGRTLYATPRL